MSWEYWTPEPEPGLSLDLCATCNAVKVSSAQQVAEMQAEISSLLNTLADGRTESMKLRAALEEIAYGNPLHNENDLMRIARAALEGK